MLVGALLVGALLVGASWWLLAWCVVSHVGVLLVVTALGLLWWVSAKLAALLLRREAVVAVDGLGWLGAGAGGVVGWRRIVGIGLAGHGDVVGGGSVGDKRRSVSAVRDDLGVAASESCRWKRLLQEGLRGDRQVGGRGLLLVWFKIGCSGSTCLQG